MSDLTPLFFSDSSVLFDDDDGRRLKADGA